jgi:solute carrier family 6 amino acid transporter-like protein 5/7/9/14
MHCIAVNFKLRSSCFQVYNRTSASEEYYNKIVLGLEEDTTWENYGGLRWQLVLCLLGAWIIVCLCLIKGVQSSGKVVYFTALFPYLVLVILLIKGATLDGAADGIKFYLQPKMETLLTIGVWSDAATQIFYSLGPAFGGLITLSSYNKFNNNCHRDAVLIALANCSTSVFAGFVIFSIIGFMAKELGQDVGDVIKSGPGLAFVAYPEAVTKLPYPPLWSFLFFMMLITLGLDSQFTMTETLTTAVMDQWPALRKQKALVVVGACSMGFLLGLTMCTNGGVYMFTLIDSFSSSWSLLLLAITEVLLIMWVYGYSNFFDNIDEMGIKMPKISFYYWKANWFAITPIILSFITIVTLVNFKPASYGDYVFPDGIQALGWMMASTPVVIFFGFAASEFYFRQKAGKPIDIRSMMKPSGKFGPAVRYPTPTATTNGKSLAEASYSNEAYTSSNM